MMFRRRRTPYAYPLEAPDDHARAISPAAFNRRRCAVAALVGSAHAHDTLTTVPVHRAIYRLGLRACHVGSNRYSRYRELSTHTDTHRQTHVHTHSHTDTHSHIHTCTYAHAYTYTHIHTHVQIHTHAYTYTYIHTRSIARACTHGASVRQG
jgi:hypothetical protein